VGDFKSVEKQKRKARRGVLGEKDLGEGRATRVKGEGNLQEYQIIRTEKEWENT